MENKENVYEKDTQTGAVADANSAMAQEKECASTVLGKFKDVNALARAYGALEAEFTRRSQRLKELEYQLSNNSQESNEAAMGAEKLRKHAKVRKEMTKAFDEFVSSVGKAHTDDVAEKSEFDGDTALEEPMKNPKTEIFETQTPSSENERKEGGVSALNEKNTLAAMPEGEGNATERKMETAKAASPLSGENAVGEKAVFKGENVFSAVAKNENTEVSSEELYRRVSRDEGVRLKIIGEYLASIGKSGAPLTAAGTGVPISPPLKAKNIGDASAMALQYFKQSY